MKTKKTNFVSSPNFISSMNCGHQNSDDVFDNYIKSNSIWIKFKNKNKIPAKYITDENKDLFIFMLSSGMNAEQVFLSKIKELENICKK
jgi:hypothetical protein